MEDEFDYCYVCQLEEDDYEVNRHGEIVNKCPHCERNPERQQEDEE